MKIDQVVFCPRCGEKRKKRNSKVFYDPKLSDKSKGKIVFFCTNHDPYPIHFCIEEFTVNDAISSMRIYIMYGKIPNDQ